MLATQNILFVKGGKPDEASSLMIIVRQADRLRLQVTQQRFIVLVFLKYRVRPALLLMTAHFANSGESSKEYICAFGLTQLLHVESTEPSMKYLHRYRGFVAKPQVVLDTDVKKIFILGVVKLIERELIVIAFGFGIAEMLETVPIQV
jgi:hypothetical protein